MSLYLPHNWNVKYLISILLVNGHVRSVLRESTSIWCSIGRIPITFSITICMTICNRILCIRLFLPPKLNIIKHLKILDIEKILYMNAYWSSLNHSIKIQRNWDRIEHYFISDLSTLSNNSYISQSLGKSDFNKSENLFSVVSFFKDITHIKHRKSCIKWKKRDF